MPLPRRMRKAVVTGADKVHVMVRVRPPRAVGEGGPSLTIDTGANTVEGMAFDRVFGHLGTRTGDVFDALLPTIDSWLQGYNGCVFAYGQTGSGKTHTMLGPDGGKREIDGVIPMTVKYALEHITAEQERSRRLDPNTLTSHRVRATYVEVYNNELRDLLSGHPSAGKSSEINVREDSAGRVFMTGASEVTVNSPADLMELVQFGATRRATGRTDMNEHSSRSHAILTLHHQHRWKPAGDVAGKRLKQTEAALHLVDLAGSEYAKRTGNTGDRLKESVAINTGLFALGNVIAALAGHRDRRVGDHVPFRDSLLTRMLQSALGGDSRTVMLVCCSPAEDDLAETRGSLRYAASARNIESRATLQISDFKPEKKPLDDDIVDPVPELDRRCIWLEVPGFGDVYCRCVGDPVDGELMLFVHGSGPTNSSTFWNDIIWELAVREHPTPYYCVAIDCPGYGRSPGDRQTIRSLPGQFLTAVVHALGFRQCLGLTGSSQGAASVFNAVLENPGITRHVCVVHPVGHDVFRYKAIKQPCLLIFDTEDAGHPVKVGRWMRDNIPNCTYFEFAMSTQPYWPSDHTAVELIKLVEGSVVEGQPSSTQGGPQSAAGIRGLMRRAASRLNDVAMESMQRLAGGLVAWCEHQGFGAPIKPVDMGVLAPPSTFLLDDMGEDMVRQLTLSDVATTFATEDSRDAEGTQWEANLDAKSHRIYYVNTETLEIMWRKPRHGTIVEPPSEQVDDGDGAAAASPDGGLAPRPPPAATAASGKKKSGRKGISPPPPAPAVAAAARQSLFDDEPVDDDHGPAPSPEEEDALRREQQQCELGQTDCERCGEALGAQRPVRFAACRHIICELCYVQTAQFTGLCPVCHHVLSTVPAKVVANAGTVPQQDEEHEKLLAVLATSDRALARDAEMRPQLELRKKAPRVVIEYGNTATGEQGSAMTVAAYSKIVVANKGASKTFNVGPGSLDCVSFNINPDFPKSAVKVREHPFTLTRTMATRFTCEMAVTLSATSGLPPIAIPYSIHHEPVTRRRVVVYFTGHDAPAKAGHAAKKFLQTPQVVDVETTIEHFV